MGSTEVEHSNDVEGWRMALLLLGFATVTFILEKSLQTLERMFESKRGLAIALEHIKNELLYVGSISLLLSAFQNLLAQICIPLSETSVYNDRRRHLLASKYTAYCEPEGQSLWPIALQHDTHIFIFVVACTHVVYGTITVYLTIWRVKTWREWEDEACTQAVSGDVKVMKMPAKWLYRHVGSNPVIHFFLMLLRQYQMSVNKSLYSNARALFIEKEGLEYDFNFHAVVVKGLEDELMHTLHPEWHLWIIAVVWYAIPPPSYVSFWMYGIAVLLISLLAGKLVDILVQISVQAAVKYGDSVVFGRMDSNPRAHGRIATLGRSSLKASLARVSPTFQQRVGATLSRVFGAGSPPTAATNENDAAARTSPDAAGAAADASAARVLTWLPQLPSREVVMEMLKSMASEISGRSFASTAAAVAVAAAAAADQQRADQAAAGQSAEERDAEKAEAAAAPPPPPLPQGVLPGVGSSGHPPLTAMAPPPRRLGLERLSAPVELPRQRLYAAASNSFKVAAADSFKAAGGSGAGPGAPRPPAAKHNLSVIDERRVGRHLGPHARHHHNHHHHHRHSHVNDLGQGQRVDGEGAPAQQQHTQGPRAPTGAQSAQQPQQQPRHSPGQLIATAASRRSAFETSQAHPDYRPQALSLRRALNAIVGPHDDLPSARQRSGRTAAPAAASVGGAPPDDSIGRQVAPGDAADAAGAGAAAFISAEGSSFRHGPKALAAAAAVPAEIQPASSEGGRSRRLSSGHQGVSSVGPSLGAATCFSGSVSGSWSRSGGGGRGASELEADETQGAAGPRRRRRRWLHRVCKVERTISGRRRVPLLMRPCYCGHKYVVGSSQYVRELLERRAAREMHKMDAVDFFWFRRPRFMTALFTLAYFQNSLSIAICIFSLAGIQDTVSSLDLPTWAVGLQLALDVLLVPQVSLAVLPLYALIQPLGSHCPRELVDFVRQKDAEDKEAKAKKAKLFGRTSRFIQKGLTELSSHLLRDTRVAPGTTAGRSMLSRLRDVLWRRTTGAQRSQREQAVAEAEAAKAAVAAAAGAPPPSAGQSRSFSPGRTSRAISRIESRVARAASEVAASSRFKPKDTETGSLGTASRSSVIFLRRRDPKRLSAGGQSEPRSSIRGATGLAELHTGSASSFHRITAPAGPHLGELPLAAQVEVVVDGQQQEGEGEGADGAGALPQAGAAAVGRQPIAAAPAAAAVAPAKLPSEHSNGSRSVGQNPQGVV